MTTRWLLDTSALLALRDDEDGAERVAQLLQAAQGGESRCLVCFMSRMEVLDRVWKDEGERQARLADAQREGAVLLHKDPEFRALDQVLQEWLG
jgi:ribonuclease VapC